MKIIIDTAAKTVSMDNSVNIVELLDTLKSLLPNDLWKEYKIIPPEYSYPVNYPFTIGNPYLPYVPYAPIEPYYYGGTDPYFGEPTITSPTVLNPYFTITTTDN
jgi:hypothetical protein